MIEKPLALKGRLPSDIDGDGDNNVGLPAPDLLESARLVTQKFAEFCRAEYASVGGGIWGELCHQINRLEKAVEAND